MRTLILYRLDQFVIWIGSLDSWKACEGGTSNSSTFYLSSCNPHYYTCLFEFWCIWVLLLNWCSRSENFQVLISYRNLFSVGPFKFFLPLFLYLNEDMEASCCAFTGYQIPIPKRFNVLFMGIHWGKKNSTSHSI